MNKTEVLAKLSGFRERLQNEVVSAYSDRGSAFGRQRFAAWRTQFTKFLDEHLPGASARFNEAVRLSVISVRRGEPDVAVFRRTQGEPTLAFLDSLRIDVENDEFNFSVPAPTQMLAVGATPPPTSSRVFIVHGHDELAKTQTARFIEKLGYEAVILHEQASRGMTIIEKIEANTDVGFAIVLYTEDDKGNSRDAASGTLNSRARQNVVFEHGYLIAKLGRPKVVPLVSGNVELPSDISGVIYVADSNWQIEIAKEMKSAGYNIDFNRVFER